MSVEVGIRELRQNLSVYLRRVAQGEHLIVTDRNRPVAQLGPPPAAQDEYERVCRELDVRRGRGSWWDVPTVSVQEQTPSGPGLDEILSDLRRDKI